MVRRTKKNQNQKKCCKTGIVSQNHGSQNQKKSFRRIILRNVAYSPLDSESRGASRGDFSTTPVSSKDGPLWTLDNFLVTCPLPCHGMCGAAPQNSENSRNRRGVPASTGEKPGKTAGQPTQTNAKCTRHWRSSTPCCARPPRRASERARTVRAPARMRARKAVRRRRSRPC